MFPDISQLMKPREIVIVGASEKENSLAKTTYENIVNRSNFDKNKVHLVNPRYSEMFGKRCYKKVSDIGSSDIDVAIILIKADYVPDVVRECADSGIGYALIMTAGFAEVGGKGIELQAQLEKVINETSIRVYGPNCPGLTDLNNRLGMTFSMGYSYDFLSGGIGLASQGGGMGRCIMQGQKRGIGFGYFISTGNEIDLELSDFIHYMLHDPKIKVVAAVVEGFKDGEKFKEVAKIALQKKKPIVLLKIARSELGQKVVMSHTGSMAGSDEILETLCKQYGVVRVDDIDELLEISALFARGGIRKSTELAIVSGSGGTNVLTADLCGQMGLELAEFDLETIEKLTKIGSAYASFTNPVDLTADIFSDETLHKNSIKAVLEDKNVDLVIVPVYANYGKVTEKICQDLVEIAPESTKLLIPIWMSPMDEGGLKYLEEGKLIPFLSVKNTILAVKRYVTYCHFIHQQDERNDDKDIALTPVDQSVINMLKETDEHALDEYTSKKLLSSIDIPVTNEKLVQSYEEAVVAAKEIGYPVALKVVSPHILHKTEAGVVALNIHSDQELQSAFEQIQQAVITNHPHAKIEGVLVSEMVQEGLEMILGLKYDPQYGSVILIGLGGIYTELLEDVAIGMNPISKQYALSLISKLKGFALLNGYRDGEIYDVDALASTVEKLSHFAARAGKHVAELDINPLVVFPEERGVKALDALIIPNKEMKEEVYSR